MKTAGTQHVFVTQQVKYRLHQDNRHLPPYRTEYASLRREWSRRDSTADAGGQVPPIRRTLPTGGDPVDLSVLAEWVESLMVRYAAAGDWLRPCWWHHGFVVEELAALRVAWLAVYNASEPVDPAAGVRWHEEAEKCRERVRRTISAGPGCTAVSHKPDEAGTKDPRWIEESAVLHGHPATKGTGP